MSDELPTNDAIVLGDGANSGALAEYSFEDNFLIEIVFISRYIWYVPTTYYSC